MYAPPRTAAFETSDATSRSEVWFEITVSEKHGPSGSESDPTSAPNADGAGAGDATGGGALDGGAIEPSGGRGEETAEAPGDWVAAGPVPQAVRRARSGSRVR